MRYYSLVQMLPKRYNLVLVAVRCEGAGWGDEALWPGVDAVEHYNLTWMV